MSYYIVKHDGKVNQIIDKKGKPNKYGEPKIFETMGAAINWCDRRTYGGMTHYYEIKEVKNELDNIRTDRQGPQSCGAFQNRY